MLSDRLLELRKSLLDPNDTLALERVVGENTLLQINFFSIGLRAGQAVCRIHIRNAKGRPDGYGTGFMVSPTLMLTNQHVLPSADYARLTLVEFNFELDMDFEPKPTHYFKLAPERFFFTDEKLDFALVAVNPLSKNGTRLSEFGFLTLTEKSGKALASEFVSIIQHPEGSDKQISIRNNRVLNRFESYIHYEADTLPGSSGAPVFNDQWQVVALHHAGVPKKSDGCILKKNGEAYERGDSPDDVQWIANEGIRISSIFECLKAKQKWDPSEVRLLEELGTYSNSNLHETIATNIEDLNILVSNDSAKRPASPDIKPIKIDELVAMLEDDETSEQDLAAYFTLSQKESRGMDPLFEVNQELVVMTDSLKLHESATLLNSANWIAKRTRQKLYRQKTAKRGNKPIKIMSEGDSWFQFPFILHDVIDHLMAEPDFAIMCFGEAGDLLRDMVAKAEFISAIEIEQPDFFLLSGGGNDLVADRGLKKYLNPLGDQFEPRFLIDRLAFAQFRARILSDYINLFSIILRAKPDINILCHGYSYPIPSSGRWLGTPMNDLGITDNQIQSEIIRLIIDEMNDAIQQAASSFPQRVHYLDLTNVVPARGWFDELHPTNPFYGDVAAVFAEKIWQLCR